jgi:mycothiol synthase
MVVRGYRSEDEAALLQTWGAALPFDPLDPRTFRRKVLLDPNFDPDWLLVAESDARPIGFCLCLIRRHPTEGLGLEPGRGWITAMGVHPEWRRQGVGSALLERALDLFRGANRSEVLIAPYTPHYFVPGVDVDRYSEGLAFLQQRGFEVASRPLSMDANIALFDYGKWEAQEEELRERGIAIRAMRPHETPALLGFLKAHMPEDWVRHARELLLDMTRGLADEEQITIAVRDGELLGYCQFEGEHFGPFGVRSDMRGQGIGSLLLAKCLLTMRRQSHHNAWLLWTSDDAAEKVYARFGFRETRRFAILRRRL